MSNDLLNETVDETETINEDYAPEMLDEEYRPVSQLHIPAKAKEKYLGLNWDLQWVRMYVPGSQQQLDINNIQKKETDQYQFVPRSDIPGLTESMTSYFGEEIVDNAHGLYVVGDMVLAKYPLVRQKARREFFAKRTQQRSRAIIDDLKKNDLMPNTQAGEKFETIQQGPQSRTVEFGD